MRIPSARRLWEEVGIATRTGAVDRPLPAAGLPIPERIKLDRDNDRLLYWWNDERLVPVPEDLLTRFVRLGETLDGKPRSPLPEEILVFVKAFGPLNVWEVRTEWDRFRDALPRGCYFGDPLEFWRYYIAAMRDILDIAALARQRQPVPLRLWKLLCAPPRRRAEIPGRLQGIVNKFLRLGEASPSLLWDPTASRGASWNPRLVMDSGGLFGNLALQLATAVVGGGGWAVCKSCGQRFWIVAGKRGRRPLYCDRPSCGRRARWRAAAAEAYRRRKRQEGKDNGKAPRAR